MDPRVLFRQLDGSLLEFNGASDEYSSSCRDDFIESAVERRRRNGRAFRSASTADHAALEGGTYCADTAGADERNSNGKCDEFAESFHVFHLSACDVKVAGVSVHLGSLRQPTGLRHGPALTPWLGIAVPSSKSTGRRQSSAGERIYAEWRGSQPETAPGLTGRPSAAERANGCRRQASQLVSGG